jgi:hypothetical protein
VSTKEMMRTLLLIGQLSGNYSWAVDNALRVENAETIGELGELLTDCVRRAKRFDVKNLVDTLEFGGLLADLDAMAANMRALAAVLPAQSRPAFDADLSDVELDELIGEIPDLDEAEYAAMLESLIADENVEAASTPTAEPDTRWADPSDVPAGDDVHRWPFYRQLAARKIRLLAPVLAAHGIVGFEQYAEQMLDSEVDAAELVDHLYSILDTLAFEAICVGAVERFEAVTGVSAACVATMSVFALFAK